MRFHCIALLLCVPLSACALDASEEDWDEEEPVAEARASLTPPSARIYRDPMQQGPTFTLLPGHVYTAAQLGPVFYRQASSLKLTTGIMLTICNTGTPSQSEVAAGSGRCRKMGSSTPQAFSWTDGGGIFSTDGGGIYSTDGGGIFSMPTMSSGWNDAIGFIKVDTAP